MPGNSSAAAESGEDMESGRANRANDHTRIWAERPSENEDFNGTAIFIAEVSLDVEDPDDFENNDWGPNHPVDGVVGIGWSGNNTLLAGNIGGIGVVGKGGNNQGTGVLGLGGGEGVGGIGVHGVGGSQGEPTWDANDPPGTGIVAQGGRQATNELRLPHGAGVVAVAGGSKRPVPPLADTGSVGVYAQGAEAETRTINLNGEDTVVGPRFPGAGVVGRGGVPIPRVGPIAPGVLGLAGDTAIPPFSDVGNAGVYGRGPIGVKGHGDSNTGVLGVSDADRGGTFSAVRSAQVRLIPIDVEGPAQLQSEGAAGDLLVTSVRDERGTRIAELWFCNVGGPIGSASWTKIA